MAYQPRIAIVGGGPSGLTLALLLNKRGIKTTVYELRPKPTAEELSRPSGSLDLHQNSGLEALRQCGIFDEFLTLTGDCTDQMKVCSKDGKVLWVDNGDLDFRPEIPRFALIGLLLKHLPAELIRWDHKVVSVFRSTATAGNTEITIDLGDKGMKTYDFVVGADGAWSKVRDLLTAVKPSYSGTQFIWSTITQISKKYPHLAELAGSGTLFALGDRKCIVSHRGVQDSARFNIGFEHEEENFGQTSGWASKTYDEVKQILVSDNTLFAGWSPALRELITASFDEETTRDPSAKIDLRSLYMLPVGHRWDNKPGVTVIGDAAHLMTPWAGEGVNLAMWDALDLSGALIKASEVRVDSALAYQKSLAPLVKDFENKMLKRAKGTAAETWSNKQLLLGEDGATEMAKMFKTWTTLHTALVVGRRIALVIAGLGVMWYVNRRIGAKWQIFG